jgi:hypothetical protein
VLRVSCADGDRLANIASTMINTNAVERKTVEAELMDLMATPV